MSGTHVSIDDLAFAADWMDTYDGRDEDGTLSDNDKAAQRVVVWLVAEIARRHEDAAVRDLVKKTGATPAAARAALRRAMSKGDGNQ